MPKEMSRVEEIYFDRVISQLKGDLEICKKKMVEIVKKARNLNGGHMDALGVYNFSNDLGMLIDQMVRNENYQAQIKEEVARMIVSKMDETAMKLRQLENKSE